jgi:steroid delta-isomerase-like uncharacterized protein
MGDTGHADFADKIWRGAATPEGASPEENAQTASRLYQEVWNKGDLNAVGEWIDLNFHQENNLIPGLPDGPNGYKQLVSTLRAAFPDLSIQLEQVLAEGDRVAARLKLAGTHKGAFLGISPTDKQVTIGGMQFLRFEDGKIVEAWGLSDLPGLMAQLQGGGGGRP